MEIRNLLINLGNPVQAFSAQSRHIDVIRRCFPDTQVWVAENSADFRKRLAEADCVLTWVFKKEWYDGASSLKAVFTPAAGHDWVEEDPSGRVKNFYGHFHGRIMRESLISMMLYFNRKLSKSLGDQQHKVWGRLGYNDCRSIFNQRVLIAGFGSLGQSMAELLTAFGARVIGVKRNLAGFEKHPHAVKMINFDRMLEELPEADHVVLVLPGGAETDGIFTASHFQAMKQGACLFNLGRGNCYRETDLIDALNSGSLKGAGLDVFSEEPLPESSPLWMLPNVLITPHSSAISSEYVDLFIDEWLETVKNL